ELSKRTDWSRGPSTADPDYRHAPQEAIDAFKDLKFGIRIHWGKSLSASPANKPSPSGFK
ncbi:MAG: hypothetical protein ACRD18_01330, partial [Terriglobia bacterium]